MSGAVREAARGAYLASNQIKTKAHLTKKSYRLSECDKSIESNRTSNQNTMKRSKNKHV